MRRVGSSLFGKVPRRAFVAFLAGTAAELSAGGGDEKIICGRARARGARRTTGAGSDGPAMLYGSLFGCSDKENNGKESHAQRLVQRPG